MSGWHIRVKHVIEKPVTGIYRDADYETRNVYYGHITLHRRRMYLKVIVEFDENNRGTVITAFPADSPKPGESLIWPSSSV